MPLLIACLIVLGLLPPLASADPGADLARFLPKEIAGWKPSREDRAFTRGTIFEYLDGGGETYLGYGFRRLLVREYLDAAGSLLAAEIYDMGTAADAYGVFSNDPDGEDVPVGREAIYGGGLLRFWKGPYFVRLLAERETGETKSVLLGLGLRVAAAIPEGGSKPALLECLPLERLEKKSVRYFHKQVSLNAHYYLADENVLLLDERTEVALARYKAEWGKAMLLVCRYRTPADARRAYLKFRRAYFSPGSDPNAGRTVEMIENGEFAGARLAGPFLILVFESPDRGSCESLLRSAETRIREVSPFKNTVPGKTG
ncbi:MAG: DUF6599 family protein [Candidatus Aminicenantales bacterium]|jgi:hypothetical protein